MFFHIYLKKRKYNNSSNFNPFLTNVPPLNPLKTSENWRFSNVFQGGIEFTFKLTFKIFFQELEIEKLAHIYWKFFDFYE